MNVFIIPFSLVCEMQARCYDAGLPYSARDPRSRALMLAVVDDEIRAARAAGLATDDVVNGLLDTRNAIERAAA